MGDIITNIETNIKALIEGMTIAGGYNYDWGTINNIDETKQDVYPTAIVQLFQIQNIDEASGASGTISNRATFEIIIKARLTSEENIPLIAIHEEEQKAFEDLLRLFGNNYSLCVDGSPACHYIKFDEVLERERHETGNMFRPSDFITRWEIFYSQLSTNPSVLV